MTLNVILYMDCIYLYLPIDSQQDDEIMKKSGIRGKGQTGSKQYSIVFMYNSNPICLPLWLIAISQGPSPLYWVWGKCCWNLIEPHCVVSHWGGPLYCLLLTVRMCVCHLSFFPLIPLVFYPATPATVSCPAARPFPLWNYKVPSKRRSKAFSYHSNQPKKPGEQESSLGLKSSGLQL